VKLFGGSFVGLNRVGCCFQKVTATPSRALEGVRRSAVRRKSNDSTTELTLSVASCLFLSISFIECLETIINLKETKKNYLAAVGFEPTPGGLLKDV
jgi:hypothetical protein